jgi:preprotein translocase subunit SecA
MRTFGVQPGEAITHPWLNRAIGTAQRKVEERNYEQRKNLLKYDDVVNDQRKAVFEQRQLFMESADLSEQVAEMRRDTIEDVVQLCLPPKTYAEQWKTADLKERLQGLLGMDLPIEEWAAVDGVTQEDIEQKINEAADAHAAEREALIGAEQARGLEKNFMLQMIDMQWREHLMHLDHLRQVIGLRGYGQRDPLNEYKTEAYGLFETLMVELRQNVTRWVMTVEFQFQQQPMFEPQPGSLFETHLDPTTGTNERDGVSLGTQGGFMDPALAAQLPPSALPEGWMNTPRNGMCPCGSGKKFKHCHGSLI